MSHADRAVVGRRAFRPVVHKSFGPDAETVAIVRIADLHDGTVYPGLANQPGRSDEVLHRAISNGQMATHRNPMVEYPRRLAIDFRRGGRLLQPSQAGLLLYQTSPARPMHHGG